MGPRCWLFAAGSFALPTCKLGTHVPACPPCPLPKPLRTEDLHHGGDAALPAKASWVAKGGHDFKDLVPRQDGEGKNSRAGGAVEMPENRRAAVNTVITSE